MFFIDYHSTTHTTMSHHLEDPGLRTRLLAEPIVEESRRLRLGLSRRPAHRNRRRAVRTRFLAALILAAAAILTLDAILS